MNNNESDFNKELASRLDFKDRKEQENRKGGFRSFRPETRRENFTVAGRYYLNQGIDNDFASGLFKAAILLSDAIDKDHHIVMSKINGGVSFTSQAEENMPFNLPSSIRGQRPERIGVTVDFARQSEQDPNQIVLPVRLSYDKKNFTILYIGTLEEFQNVLNKENLNSTSNNLEQNEAE